MTSNMITPLTELWVTKLLMESIIIIFIGEAIRLKMTPGNLKKILLMRPLISGANQSRLVGLLEDLNSNERI